MQPIGVDSDSTAVSLYRADDSTGSAAFTGLAGEDANVTRDPAANAMRTTMERVFLFICEIYPLSQVDGRLKEPYSLNYSMSPGASG